MIFDVSNIFRVYFLHLMGIPFWFFSRTYTLMSGYIHAHIKKQTRTQMHAVARTRAHTQTHTSISELYFDNDFSKRFGATNLFFFLSVLQQYSPLTFALIKCFSPFPLKFIYSKVTMFILHWFAANTNIIFCTARFDDTTHVESYHV